MDGVVILVNTFEWAHNSVLKVILEVRVLPLLPKYVLFHIVVIPCIIAGWKQNVQGLNGEK